VTLAGGWRQLVGFTPVRVSGPVHMTAPETPVPPPVRRRRPQERIDLALQQISLYRQCVAEHSTLTMLTDLDRILRGDR
jgi:hypothetical protein